MPLRDLWRDLNHPLPLRPTHDFLNQFVFLSRIVMPLFVVPSRSPSPTDSTPTTPPVRPATPAPSSPTPNTSSPDPAAVHATVASPALCQSTCGHSAADFSAPDRSPILHDVTRVLSKSTYVTSETPITVAAGLLYVASRVTGHTYQVPGLCTTLPDGPYEFMQPNGYNKP